MVCSNRADEIQQSTWKFPYTQSYDEQQCEHGKKCAKAQNMYTHVTEHGILRPIRKGPE